MEISSVVMVSNARFEYSWSHVNCHTLSTTQRNQPVFCWTGYSKKIK